MFVYLLESLAEPGERYVGLSRDYKRRLRAHNAGLSEETCDYRPWRPVAVFWIEDRAQAYAFETFLKSQAGRAFANFHFPICLENDVAS